MGKKSKRNRGGGGGNGGNGGGGGVTVGGSIVGGGNVAASGSATTPALASTKAPVLDDDRAVTEHGRPTKKPGSNVLKDARMADAVEEEEEEETADNLRFEDPFEDVYEEEVVDGDVVAGGVGEDNDVMEEESDGNKDNVEEKERAKAKYTSAVERAAAVGGDVVLSWNPLTCPIGERKGGKMKGNGKDNGNDDEDEDEELVMDESAYKMHHAIRPEWPSLSFDFVRDSLGDGRTRFPHSCIVAVGSQAAAAAAAAAEGGRGGSGNRRRKNGKGDDGKNRLTILRLGDLGRTYKKKDDDDEEEDDWESADSDNDDDDDDDEDDDDDDDEDEDLDLDPTLEHYMFRHDGIVNRIRCMPQNPSVVATWSDSGNVHLYDVQAVLDLFDLEKRATAVGADAGGNGGGGGTGATARKGGVGYRKDPFFVYSGHTNEGYALDWSSVVPGRLATGDCDGNIHVWDPASPLSAPTFCPVTTSKKTTSRGGGSSNNNNNNAKENKRCWDHSSFRVRHLYGPTKGSSDGCDNLDHPSVEDLQWSPTEGTVLASAECGGYVKVYDIRAPGRAMISRKIHDNGSDVNVIAWNRCVANLLATGGDDGTFAVWDLRSFQTPVTKDDSLSSPSQSSSSSSSSSSKPLARFSCHRTPITSLEWHPTDESMIAITDDVGTYVYDLSVEEDDIVDENNANANNSLPPQLLFIHAGSKHTKEVHWHPQIPSLLMTTSQSGYNVFIPSNL